MESIEYKELNKKLIAAGAIDNINVSKKGVVFNLKNPIDIFVNTKTSALPYENILLEYALRLKDNELEMVIRSMTEKGFSKSTSFLLSLFKGKDISEHILWVAGNALNVINNKNSYDEILNICKDKSFGKSREMLVGILSKIKTEEAFTTLIELLNDKEIRGHVIEALGKFGRVEAIINIEGLEVEKGKYEYKAKNTALKKLKNKLSKKLPAC